MTPCHEAVAFGAAGRMISFEGVGDAGACAVVGVTEGVEDGGEEGVVFHAVAAVAAGDDFVVEGGGVEGEGVVGGVVEGEGAPVWWGEVSQEV